MAGITFKDVIKRYGRGKHELQVIHGVNAEVGDGEFVVIVGPSGCGKSTLLRMVAGLEEITSGEISIGGRVVNQLEPVHHARADRDLACGDLLQPGHHAQQRALAAARRAHDDDELAVGDLGVHAVDHLHALGAAGVGLLDLPE